MGRKTPNNHASPVPGWQIARDNTGTRLMDGHQVQVVVPGGTWQGSLLDAGGKYALLGTTVAPGFDYADYESGEREDLICQYPGNKELITRLTPDKL